MVGEVKVATVEAESSVDNMATLPVSRAHGGGANNQQHPAADGDKNNASVKEMELKNVQPKPNKRYRPLCLSSLSCP